MKLSTTVFNYPLIKGTIENYFDPKKNIGNFQKYMLIKKDNEEIILSEEFIFIHENPDKLLYLKYTDLLDGTWWILP